MGWGMGEIIFGDNFWCVSTATVNLFPQAGFILWTSETFGIRLHTGK